MKRVVSQMKRTLSMVLAFMMVATAIPQTAMTVLADEADVIEEAVAIDETEMLPRAEGEVRLYVNYDGSSDAFKSENITVTGDGVRQVESTLYSKVYGVSANSTVNIKVKYDASSYKVTDQDGFEYESGKEYPLTIDDDCSVNLYAEQKIPAKYDEVTNIKTKALNKKLNVAEVSYDKNDDGIYELQYDSNNVPVVEVTYNSAIPVDAWADITIVDKVTGEPVDVNKYDELGYAKLNSFSVEVKSVSENNVIKSDVYVKANGFSPEMRDKTVYTLTVNAKDDTVEKNITAQKSFDFTVVTDNYQGGFYFKTEYSPVTMLANDKGEVLKDVKSGKPSVAYLNKKVKAEYELDVDALTYATYGPELTADEIKNIKDNVVVKPANGQVTIKKTIKTVSNNAIYVPVKATYKAYNQTFTATTVLKVYKDELASKLAFDAAGKKAAVRLVEKISENKYAVTVSENKLKGKIEIDNNKEYYLVALKKGTSISANEFTADQLYMINDGRISAKSSSAKNISVYNTGSSYNNGRVVAYAAKKANLTINPSEGSKVKFETVKVEATYKSAKDVMNKLTFDAFDYYGGEQFADSVSQNDVAKFAGMPYRPVIIQTAALAGDNLSKYNIQIAKVDGAKVMYKGHNTNGKSYAVVLLKNKKDTVTVTLKDAADKKNTVKATFTVKYTNGAASVSANKFTGIKSSGKLYAGSFSKQELTLTKLDKAFKGDIKDAASVKIELDPVSFNKDSKRGAYDTLKKAISANVISISNNSATLQIMPNAVLMKGNYKAFATVLDKEGKEISVPAQITIKVGNAKVLKNTISVASKTTIKQISGNTIAVKGFKNAVSANTIIYVANAKAISGNKVIKKNQFTDAFEVTQIDWSNPNKPVLQVTVKNEALAKEKANQTGYIMIVSNAGKITAPEEKIVGKRTYVQKITIKYAPK